MTYYDQMLNGFQDELEKIAEDKRLTIPSSHNAMKAVGTIGGMYLAYQGHKAYKHLKAKVQHKAQEHYENL